MGVIPGPPAFIEEEDMAMANMGWRENALKGKTLIGFGIKPPPDFKAKSADPAAQAYDPLSDESGETPPNPTAR